MVYLKRTALALIAGIAIVLVALGIIVFARGYRFNLDNGKLGSQGILVANSAPTNAQIYVNGEFVGLTSDNLYLKPGFYQIVIKKEGYSPWYKRFGIKGEVVSRVDAQLFSGNPSLSPLTNNGVINPLLSPSRTKVSYLVLPEANPLTPDENGGIMLGKLTSNTLNFFKQHNQLIPYPDLPSAMIPEKTRFLFANDEKNLLVFFYDELDNLLAVYLTTINGNRGDFLDVTLSYQQFLDKWWLQKKRLQEKLYDTARLRIRQTLKAHTSLVEVSPDKSKFVYLALTNAVLPRVIQPSLIGSVPTQETRQLQAASFYVYDKKEDKNFLLKPYPAIAADEAVQFLQSLAELDSVSVDDWFKLNRLFDRLLWYSDSRHLVFNQNATIVVIEYDGANKTVVYSGPFEQDFLAVSDDGRIVTLTNINPKKNKLPDLYSVSIK